MEQYLLLITIVGIAAFIMAWMPAFTKWSGISYSILFVAAGAVLYLLLPGYLPSPLPADNPETSVRLTEIVVIISLMGTGIKIDRAFSFKNWRSPLRLISMAMLICIAGAALIGYYWLGLDPAAALLLGAVLAPTDPVLASDVQVAPPNVSTKSETRFALTAEAGLNDGMSFPFTWLAITLAIMATGGEANIMNWLGYHLLYKIAAGLLVGVLIGRLAGYLIFKIAPRYKFLETKDGFVSISLTLLVYGITEMIHGYGFIAVFVAAITFRHFEKEHEYHEHLHSFTDQAERLLVAVILLLFGGALTSGILDALNWKLVIFSLVFIFLLRPASGLLSMAGTRVELREKLAIGFFGIRGIGSLFYLAFAVREVNFMKEAELWSAISFTILLSIIIHGLTASRAMKFLKRAGSEKQGLES